MKTHLQGHHKALENIKSGIRHYGLLEAIEMSQGLKRLFEGLSKGFQAV